MNSDNISTILIGIASSVIVAILLYFILPFLKIIGKKAITEFEEFNKTFRNQIISKLANRHASHMGDISAIAIVVVTITIGIAMVITENIDLSTGFISGELTSKVFGFTTMIIVFMVLGIRFLIREYIFQKIKEFETNITVLSAHLPGKQIAKLKSDWAQMQSYEDYENLTGKVEDLMEKTKPKPAGNSTKIELRTKEIILEESL